MFLLRFTAFFRWHRLALDSRLWSRVCLGGKVLKSGVIPNLMSRHPIVIRLANAQVGFSRFWPPWHFRET